MQVDGGRFLEDWNVKTRDCEIVSIRTALSWTHTHALLIYSPLFHFFRFTLRCLPPFSLPQPRWQKKKKILHSYWTIILQTTYIFNADLHCCSLSWMKDTTSLPALTKYCLQSLVVVGDKMAKKCRKLHWRICKKMPSSLSNGHSFGVGAPFIPVKAAQGCFEARSWTYVDLLWCAALWVCAPETSVDRAG